MGLCKKELAWKHYGRTPDEVKAESRGSRAILFSVEFQWFHHYRLHGALEGSPGKGDTHRNRNWYQNRKVARNRFRSWFRFRYRFRAPVVRGQLCPARGRSSSQAVPPGLFRNMLPF